MSTTKNNSITSFPKICIIAQNSIIAKAYASSLQFVGFENISAIIVASTKTLDALAVEKHIALHNPNTILNTVNYTSSYATNQTYSNNISQTLKIQETLLQIALKHHIDKFVFTGSHYSYTQTETNENHDPKKPFSYHKKSASFIKISAAKGINNMRNTYQKDFVSLMPSIIYGQNSDFSSDSNEIIPIMIRKFQKAKLQNNRPVILWGTGMPRLDFLYLNDYVEAIKIMLLTKSPEPIINVKSNDTISMSMLAKIIQKIVGHTGCIMWDDSKPEPISPVITSTPSPLTAMGWQPKTDLETGIKLTNDFFLKQNDFKI